MATKCNTSNLCQWCTFHLNGLFTHLICHIFFDNLNPSCVVYIVSSCTVYYCAISCYFRPLYQEEDISVCLSVIITSYDTLRTSGFIVNTLSDQNHKEILIDFEYKHSVFLQKKNIPLIRIILI